MIRTAAPRTWVLAEFATPAALIDAARGVRAKGYQGVDAYSPYPLHGIDDALGLGRSKVPMIALIGGLSGVALAWGFQVWMNGIDYPLNVANRPTTAGAPYMVPIIFELGVLLAALSIFFGLLALSRLPQPWHPAFEVEAFRSASTHAFWLSVPLTDAARAAELEAQLKTAGAAKTSQVIEEVER